MKTDPSAIQALNTALREVVTAINQSFLHARMLRHWGFGRLERPTYEASIRAMRHADRLIERILFLEGLPNLQDTAKLLVGEDVPEILRSDLATESRSRDALAAAIAQCEGVDDYVSRHHLEAIQEDSEARIDWLETQLSLIDGMGLPNYLESAV